MSDLPPDDRREGLRPPQYGLGALLLVVSVLCAILAAMNLFGPYAGFALGLLALTVFAHVAGNALGTRLRQLGDQRPVADGEPPGRPPAPRPRADQFAPVTRLRYRASLGRPIVVVTAIGGLVGGGAGGYLLLVTLGPKATLANMTLGVGAFAVLGCIWSFVASSFLQVLGDAFWQAVTHRESPDD